MALNKDNIDDVVKYHAPTPLQIAKIGEVRAAAATLLKAIMEHCPPCADTTAACRKVREAMMTANAAITLVRQKPANVQRQA